MAKKERIRESLNGLPTLEYLMQRIEMGWRPSAIEWERDIVPAGAEQPYADLSKHRYLKTAGYRIVRRYENNGWYVARGDAAKASLADRWEICRKYYLALPFRILRNLSRRLRKGRG